MRSAYLINYIGSFEGVVRNPDHVVLYTLAQSPVMWEQRVSVVSTLMLIRNGRFSDTMKLAEIFLETKHDLMQKAVGWMLREVGKRDKELLVSFLNTYKDQMPRTTLRYAIEKFTAGERQELMQKKHKTDSTEFNTFDQTDKEWLEEIVSLIR